MHAPITRPLAGQMLAAPAAVWHTWKHGTARGMQLNGAAAQVPIPRPLARQMLGAAAADLALTWAWEHALRATFPAPRPPAKGYQAFARELAALDKGAQQGRGRLKAE